MDRLEQMFAKKRESTHRFRTVQYELGAFANPHLIDQADWQTRGGGIELHKGLHWINLEYSEFLNAKPGERPEELADVLHFILEFCLLSGLTHEIIPQGGEDTDRLDVVLEASSQSQFVFPDAETNARFGILAVLAAAEMIKNKPWKQTLKVTRNEDEFLARVRGIWFWFGATVRTQGMSAQEIFDEYMRKEAINANRIATGV